MSFDFLGLPLEEWNVEQLHFSIEETITSCQCREFLNLNAHAVNLCFEDLDFYRILRSTDHLFCDGEGVRWAANFKGANVPQRITYADWLLDFFPLVEEKGWKIFFYGAREQVLEIVLQRIRKEYPNMKICGAVHGFAPQKKVISTLKRARPQILMVGLGMPAQEKWIRENKTEIGANVYLSSGAAFDFFAGAVPRAPKFLRKIGMEWFFRFLWEPRRMFRRYIVGNPRFLYRVWQNQTPL